MSASSPLAEKGHGSRPSMSSHSSHKRNSVSTPAGSRSGSQSPRKLRYKQPLHIRMELTETQMDRITDAFTNKVNSSPVSSGQRADVMTPSKSTPFNVGGSAFSSRSDRIKAQQHRSIKSMEMQRDGSPTFSELMPRYNADSMGLAERRRREPPAPIRVDADRLVKKTPQRPLMESVPDMVSPLTAEKLPMPSADFDTDPSIYSPEGNGASTASYQDSASLAGSSANVTNKMNDEFLKMYADWAQIKSRDGSSEGQNRPPHRRSTTDASSLRDSSQYAAGGKPPPPPPRPPVSRIPDTPLFSPLPLYFRGQGFPTVKIGEKTMIGQNGWLERTSWSPDRQKQTPQKKPGILDSIKKIAKDMSEQYNPGSRRSQPITKEAPSAQVLISLNTREQSLLYCELEFHITGALNDYISAELDKGRLVPDHLKKISDWWQQQGRPKVVGFRYDMETQLELLNMHLDDFGFHGRRQGNRAEIAGLLHAMKVNARAIRIRTFCQPDSVIAKQIVDAQSLFNLIDATSIQQLALAEVAQFFKVILERERDYREKKY